MGDIANVLRSKGFRATEGRVKLLEILSRAGEPLSVREVLERTKERLLDQVTLYRALESLSSAGVIHRIDLNGGVARYEYAPRKPHHHHAVCTNCGVIEDIESSALEKAVIVAGKSSRHFKSIYSHNLEFFGVCKKCI